MSLKTVFANASVQNNAAWVQLLGLCPLLAVSTSVVNALGLSLATTLVMVGANTSVALLNRLDSRLCPSALLRADHRHLHHDRDAAPAGLCVRALHGIALFVQIIVTNCMILSRAEAFASRNGVLPAADRRAGHQRSASPQRFCCWVRFVRRWVPGRCSPGWISCSAQPPPPGR